MKKSSKKICCMGLSFVLAFSGLGVGNDYVNTKAVAVAASKTKVKESKASISHRKVILTMGAKEKVTLTVKKASKKVKWSTSNKKIAVIKKISVSRNKKQSAVIQAKKKGKCTITAKIGKMKLQCVVTVKNKKASGGNANDTSRDENQNLVNEPAVIGSTPGAIGVMVNSVAASGHAISIKTTIYNNSKYQLGMGLDFKLEKFVGGVWTVVEPKEPLIIPALWCIGSKESATMEQSYKMETKDALTEGRYRLVIESLCCTPLEGEYSEEAEKKAKEVPVYREGEFILVRMDKTGALDMLIPKC